MALPERELQPEALGLAPELKEGVGEAETVEVPDTPAAARLLGVPEAEGSTAALRRACSLDSW